MFMKHLAVWLLHEVYSIYGSYYNYYNKVMNILSTINYKDEKTLH